MVRFCAGLHFDFFVYNLYCVLIISEFSKMFFCGTVANSVNIIMSFLLKAWKVFPRWIMAALTELLLYVFNILGYRMVSLFCQEWSEI